MKYQKGDAVLVFILFMLVVTIGLCWAVAIAARDEQREWDAFAVAQHCKVTAKAKGQTTIGTVATNKGVGTVVGVSPDQVAFTCDDGVTYWRDAQ